MSLFTLQGLSFYLQDYYVKEWIDNSMIYLRVSDVESTIVFYNDWSLIKNMQIVNSSRYKRMSGVKNAFG
jgi:hypothetical protein